MKSWIDQLSVSLNNEGELVTKRMGVTLLSCINLMDPIGIQMEQIEEVARELGFDDINIYYQGCFK